MAAQDKSLVQTMAMYLLPGMSVMLKVPVIDGRISGYFAASAADVDLEKFFGPEAAGNASNLINGFVVEDKRVGDISAGEETGSIVYTHKKAQKNAVWFFAKSGEYGVMNIVSVPIHDHSSIVQGGPAYGTYFSDDEEKTS
jgi:hypothetical protein